MITVLVPQESAGVCPASPKESFKAYSEQCSKERGTVGRARILLADDHKGMRDRALRLLEPEFEVVGAVTDGGALLDAASQMKPDVCVLDISMPIVSGIKAAARLKESGSTAKIIILTIHEDPDFVQEALNAGASGYVLKSRMASALGTAVKWAMDGRLFISPPCAFATQLEGNHEAT